MTTEISFKADGDAIRTALNIASVVTPSGGTGNGEEGFLFVVGKKVRKKEDGTPGPDDGKDFCWVYSENADQHSRAEFPIYDVEGEGAFSYPLPNIKSFEYITGEATFNVKNDFDNNAFIVKWGFGGSATLEKPTFDPRVLTPLDKQLEKATTRQTYKTAFLKEALGAGKTFLATEQNAKDECKIIYLYDSQSKGDGTLFSTDNTQRIYFSCDAFKGNGLQVHADHIGLLESFLSKCGSEVVICSSPTRSYAMTADESRVIGWPKHTKPPLDYKLMPRAWDKVVLQVKERAKLMAQIGLIKSDLQKGHDKTKLDFDQTEKQLRLQTVPPAGRVKTLPIAVEVLQYDLPADSKCLAGGPGFTHDVNINMFEILFKDVKAELIEFRMFPFEDGGKASAGFRTMDEFLLNPEGKTVGGSGAIPDPANGVFTCKVMRFMPSKR